MTEMLPTVKRAYQRKAGTGVPEHVPPVPFGEFDGDYPVETTIWFPDRGRVRLRGVVTSLAGKNDFDPVLESFEGKRFLRSTASMTISMELRPWKRGRDGRPVLG